MTGLALPLDTAALLASVDSDVRLTPAFRLGAADIEVAAALRSMPGGREHRLAPIRVLLDETMERFERREAATSDAWLGPRLHASLRLSRREAAARGVWRFLGLWASDYVRWRWGPPEGDDDVERAAKAERFDGPDFKHALGRLWWMAELFRDGKDYSTAALALTNQDIINNLFRMDIAHHRPVALAALAVLPRSDDGKTLPNGRQANALAKALNAAASTLLLDVLAPDEPLDAAARQHWESQRDDHDARLFFDRMPEGPDDPAVPESALLPMKTLLTDLLAWAPVRGKTPV